MVYEDSYGNPTGAVNAFNKLVSIDKVEIILGPIFSDNVLACAPLANSKKVLLFITAAASDDIKNAGDYVFRNRLSASSLSRVLANYIWRDNTSNNVSVLFEKSANAIDYKNGFVEKTKEIGRSILLEESFDKDNDDFRTHIQKIKAVRPDVVFITGHAKEIGYFLRQAKEMGLEGKFISTAGAESSDMLKISGSAAEDLIYATDAFIRRENDLETTHFMHTYREKMRAEPDFFSINAYDALRIIAYVGEKIGWTSENLKKGLYKLENYQSMGGEYSFDINGELKGKPIAIKTVRNGKFVLLREWSE